MDLHPYDNITRSFKSSDRNRQDGLEILTQILGFTPIENDLAYDLSFFSGGIGICDRIAITFSIDAVKLELLKTKYNLVTPQSVSKNEEWGIELFWLVDPGDADLDESNFDYTNIERYALEFIDRERFDFQFMCQLNHQIYFDRTRLSPNFWVVVWGMGEWFNFLSFDVG